jgi:hypothetical protein
VIHGVVMDTRAIRMGMIVTDPTHVAAHCHAADMNASAEAAHVGTAADTADVRASTETAHVSAAAETAHVSATAETSAVTATTSAAAPCIRRADSQCGGKRGRSQDHHHSFHRDTPRICMLTGQRGIRTLLRGQAFAMLERVGTRVSRAIQIAFTKTGVPPARGKSRHCETKEARG